MPKLDNFSRNKLNYRPNINYVEPPQEEDTYFPFPEKELPVTSKQQDQLYNLADAVEVLGATVQQRINDKAKNIKIKLDPNVDYQTVQAMCRMFGTSDDIEDCDFKFITYDQYRQCRECLCKYGNDLANQAKPKAMNFDGLLNNGGLRPELIEQAQVIKPIDMKLFTENLFKLMVRHIWKKFIRPPLRKLPVIGRKVPRNLPGTKLNKGFKKQLEQAKANGVKVLGL